MGEDVCSDVEIGSVQERQVGKPLVGVVIAGYRGRKRPLDIAAECSVEVVGGLEGWLLDAGSTVAGGQRSIEVDGCMMVVRWYRDGLIGDEGRRW